jgi:hypothetical protein
MFRVDSFYRLDFISGSLHSHKRFSRVATAAVIFCFLAETHVLLRPRVKYSAGRTVVPIDGMFKETRFNAPSRQCHISCGEVWKRKLCWATLYVRSFTYFNHGTQVTSYFVRSVVLNTVSMKTAAVWVVAPCSLTDFYRRFRGACSLRHQETSISRSFNEDMKERGRLEDTDVNGRTILKWLLDE